MYTENNTEPQDITSQVPVTEEEAFKILNEILLGGCCISPNSPDYACPVCGQPFIKTVFYNS